MQGFCEAEDLAQPSLSEPMLIRPEAVTVSIPDNFGPAFPNGDFQRGRNICPFRVFQVV